MTPSTAELARALVASPRWEWRAGMLAKTGREGWTSIDVRLCWSDDRHWHGPYTSPEKPAMGGWLRLLHDAMSDYVPDLDDPATAGVLLGMLLEAKPCGTRWSGPVVPEHEQHVSMYVGDHREYFAGPTLGVAVARALLCVWGQP